MVRQQLSALVFDLDGTLVDSQPGIVGCFRYALDALNPPCPPENVLVASIGQPLRQAFRQFLGTSNEAIIEDAVAIYRQRYGTIGLYEAAVYAGVPEMLSELDGVPAYVATSKALPYAVRVLQHFGLAPHFAGVYGPDLNGRPNHKAALVERLLREEQIDHQAIMIGDRADDIVAARANGMAAVGVLWGYGSRDELANAGADALCARPLDVVNFLRNSELSPILTA